MSNDSVRISKTVRQRVTLEILNKWGRLEKSEIDRRVATSLGVSEKSLSRSIYRDLKDMVDSQLIRVFYQAHNGSWLEPSEVTDLKSYKCYWGGIDARKDDLAGTEFVRHLGGDVLTKVSMIKAGKFSLLKAKDSLVNKRGISFPIGGTTVFFEIFEEFIPISIVVFRSIGRVEEKFREGFLSVHGGRTIGLGLPISSISGLRAVGTGGQFQLTFKPNSVIEIEDCNSKNGTRLLPFEQLSIAGSELLNADKNRTIEIEKLETRFKEKATGDSIKLNSTKIESNKNYIVEFGGGLYCCILNP